MKIAYFDCFSGIAGDMALAALLDCGVPLDELKTALASLPVEGWDITSEPVLKSGIHALSVSISEHGVTDEEELAHAKAHAENHAHEHDHHHDHDHSHGHHDHGHHHHKHHHGRSMAEIRELILTSKLSEKVKTDALQIFGKIAVAEAYLHHSTPEEIHFHEIGGLDSLLDIVGVAWCLDYLGIEKVVCSPLPLSSGFVDCAHGRMPIPAPATLEMLKGAPWVSTDLKGELVTPTGAGIVAALSSAWGAPPTMTLEKVGSGAGKKSLPDRPNILRISIGENAKVAPPDGLEWATLSLLETNIDDMNPQLFEAVFEVCFQTGALDVWTTPIGMKKGRPAVALSVLCEPKAQNDVLRALLTQTTTLGVRIQNVQRASLEREFSTVQTPLGAVKVKTARWEQQRFSRTMPEWDDVLKLARQSGASARDIYNLALEAGRESAQSE